MVAYDRLDVASVYLATFMARTDLYQVWTTDGWRPIRQEITPQVIADGLGKQGPPVGGYFPNSDGTSHVMAMDFDTDDGLAQALSVGRAMWEVGLPAYAEASRRGAHLWAVLDEIIDAKPIRRFMRAMLEAAKVPKVFDRESKLWIDNPKIELRPAADQIAEGGMGNALRLPMMPHPATGKRYALLHPGSGKPLEGDTIPGILLNVSLGDRRTVVQVASEYVPEIDPRTIDRRYSEPRVPREHDAYDDMSVSEILQTHFGVANARPHKAVKCPKHDDRVPTLSISADDKRVWCKSPSCEWHQNGRGLGTYQLMQAVPA